MDPMYDLHYWGKQRCEEALREAQMIPGTCSCEASLYGSGLRRQLRHGALAYSYVL